MANTITQTLKVVWKNDDGDSVTGSVVQTLTQSGNAVFSNVQTIGATSETITVGEVSGDCLIFFKNNNTEWSELSTASKEEYADEDDYNTKNTVYVGTTNPATSSSANTHALKPGSGAVESAVLATHYAIRDTEDVDLLVIVIEK